MAGKPWEIGCSRENMSSLSQTNNCIKVGQIEEKMTIKTEYQGKITAVCTWHVQKL